MNRTTWFVGMILLAGCESVAPTSVRSGPLQRWDPVDGAFAGCQGACGAHVEGDHLDIVAQPGATVGQRTYCPVSGAVFEVEPDHPHVAAHGQTLWFCCAGCATYFEAHRDEVLELRGIGPGTPRASVPAERSGT